MNAWEVAAVLVAGLTGGVGGGLMVVGAAWARDRRTKRGVSVIDPWMNREPLKEIDRRAVDAELEQRRNVAQRQVSEFADHLAGDDTVLRQRLKQFERLPAIRLSGHRRET